MIEQSLAQAREAGDAYWELFALVYLIEARLRLGRWDEAEHGLLEALEAQAATGVSEFNLVLPYYKAVLAMRKGNFEPAESTFRDALAKAEARESQLWEAHICLGLAELAYVTGAQHEASRWVDRAQDRAGVADALGLLAESHYLRGRIATAQGDVVEADGHHQRAQETAVQLNLLDLMARVWYERAVLQYPSPQAAKLLKRAQEVMVQQVDGLSPDLADPFLAAQGRRAIFERDLPGQVKDAEAPAPAVAPETGGDDRQQLAVARQTIGQQRVWLDELQHACGLLLKQLDFSQAIARSSDPNHVITQALALLMEVGQAERGEIFTLENGRLQSRARKQLSSLQPIDEDWTHYIDFLNEAMRSGEMVYVPDTEALPIPPRLAGPRSVLVLPINDEKDRVGAMLALGHAGESARLMKRELEALRVLAGQLGIAMRNLRMQSEWKEKTQRLEMLYQLSSTITSTLVMEEVLDMVVKLSLEITQGERGFLLLSNQDGDLECKAARHMHGPIALPAGGDSYSQSICRRVLETGEALSVEDTQDDDVFRHAKSIQDLNLRTVLCVPLKVQSKALGVLYVDSRLVVKTFTNRDVELLKSIASHASIALENARLYNLATVDGLTQLYFRSHFEQRMREELNRAKRYGTPLSLMMMDIDHFKKFNDTYGHAVGDQVLRHVAAMIKSGVRQDVDIPARYGGEEMVVLLPETDAAGAKIFAERIRAAIDETLLEADGLQGLHVTISIGIAVFPDNAETGLELMERADKALYASKAAGRNCVTVYVPEMGG
jgi:diguanylate cyclase (GGDEF)-like protein